MPELRKEDAPSLVHGIDNWLPGRQLLVLVEARRIRVPAKASRKILKPVCGHHSHGMVVRRESCPCPFSLMQVASVSRSPPFTALWL